MGTIEIELQTIIDNYVTRYKEVPQIIYVNRQRYNLAKQLPSFPLFFSKRYFSFVYIEYGG